MNHGQGIEVIWQGGTLALSVKRIGFPTVTAASRSLGRICQLSADLLCLFPINLRIDPVRAACTHAFSHCFAAHRNIEWSRARYNNHRPFAFPPALPARAAAVDVAGDISAL